MDRRGFLGGLLALAVAPLAKPAVPAVYTRPVFRPADFVEQATRDLTLYCDRIYAQAHGTERLGLVGLVDDGTFTASIHGSTRWTA